MRRIAVWGLVFCSIAWSTANAQKLPFDSQALMKVARIGDPQLAPDGVTVAFTVQTIDLDGNRKPKQIFTVPVDGGTPRQITNAGSSNDRARWSPDSKRIAFVSDRSGSSQIWIMNADGGGATQVTRLATEAGGVLFSPDGKSLLFTSDVYPDCPDEACNKARLDAEASGKVKARIYTSLLYRHWTQWQGKRRTHLLATTPSGAAPKDLTPGNRDVPPFSLGGPDDYAISPDSARLYVASTAQSKIMRLDPAVGTIAAEVPVVGLHGGPVRVAAGIEN